jgi:hypothetical protein
MHLKLIINILQLFISRISEGEKVLLNFGFLNAISLNQMPNKSQKGVISVMLTTKYFSMKNFLLSVLVILLGFTFSSEAQTYDDLYSNGSEYSNSQNNQNSQQTNQNRSNQDYLSYDAEDDVQSNQRGYTYDDDYIDFDDDSYYYTSRIRRFNRPFWSFGYFSGFYMDPYWWDWSFNYPSWYVGWNYGWGWNV